MLVETRALTGFDGETLKSNCPVQFGGYVTLTTQMSIPLLNSVLVNAVRLIYLPRAIRTSHALWSDPN